MITTESLTRRVLRANSRPTIIDRRRGILTANALLRRRTSRRYIERGGSLEEPNGHTGHK